VNSMLVVVFSAVYADCDVVAIALLGLYLPTQLLISLMRLLLN